MPATNATTKKPVTRATTITKTASSSSTAQSSAASQKQTQAAGKAATQAGTGIFGWQLPNIVPSLDQFLGLPTVIDWQDIGIRVSMVIVGIVLLLIVGWAFVHGKQTTNVNVQAPSSSIQPGSSSGEAATEAAEVA